MEIEKVIEEHPEVVEAAVFGVHDHHSKVPLNIKRKKNEIGALVWTVQIFTVLVAKPVKLNQLILKSHEPVGSSSV